MSQENRETQATGNVLDQAIESNRSAQTMNRIRNEETFSKWLLQGLDEAIKDEILLHCSHPRPGIMRIEIPGHHRIEGHDLFSGAFLAGGLFSPCYHVMRRCRLRPWRRRTVAMHNDLMVAIDAARKRSSGRVRVEITRAASRPGVYVGHLIRDRKITIAFVLFTLACWIAWLVTAFLITTK